MILTLDRRVDSIPALLALVAVVVAVVWITTSRPVVWALRPLVSPPVGWLLRKNPSGQPAVAVRT
ncbi:hypothetical protein [Micromonospora ureilytica]|uniref:hypothetical protein n=1 Tax=Micromonospora ureilytica TaxID=709868 RepID=UPI004039E735